MKPSAESATDFRRRNNLIPMWLKRYWKYFGLFVLCVGVIIALVSSQVSSNLRTLLLDQLKEGLKKNLHHTAQSIQGTFRQFPKDPDQLDRLAREIGRDTGERVSIISADGRLLGDSAREPQTTGPDRWLTAIGPKSLWPGKKATGKSSATVLS